MPAPPRDAGGDLPQGGAEGPEALLQEELAAIAKLVELQELRPSQQLCSSH